MAQVKGAASPPTAASPMFSDRPLKELTRAIHQSTGFPEVLAALKVNRSATIDGAWGSAGPLICATLGHHAPSTLAIVLAHADDVDHYRDDFETFSGVRPEIFPAWDKPPVEVGAGDDILADRLRVLKRLKSDRPFRCVIASIASLFQPVPRPEALAETSRTIRVGDALALGPFLIWLTERGMTRVEVVEVVGEFSIRGGILDIFPPDAADPIRIELFGDEVESIRPFDAGTQRSLGKLDAVSITVPPVLSPDHPEQFGHFADYLPEGSWIVLAEPHDLREEGRRYFGRIDDPRGLYPVEATFAKLIERPTVALSVLTSSTLERSCHLRIESVERFTGELVKVKAELDSATPGERVVMACHNPAEAERLRDVFADSAMGREGRLTLAVGRVHAGFRLVDAQTLVVSDHELFARPDAHKPTVRRRYESRAIESFLDLNEGDFVVHINHGIALYRGLQLLDRNDEHAEETMVLEFADRAKVYVPISKVDLVQKYVGGGHATPPLSKIGTSTWEKRKQRVAEAVLDLASELIEIQAKRAAEPGHAYPANDSHWMTAFEASFPYEETPDQERAIEAVREDLVRPSPMDRLICGDVGYGKTEVAMRAAFRVADAGKQVAILVPTTILAEQHYRSFSARMAEFPFAIECVNRFRPKAEVRQALKGLAEGKVDVLIGTHRIVQKDVKFKDLGLVVIDEEQRFGVEDKEWLKSFRATVDVLTLTATPIPRTLHMSLLGIRDISNLETPPPDRKAIETRIGRWDPEMIKRAIQRELHRGGQVFFVHNRVNDIEAIAQRLQAIVPEARILIGHGQMAGEQLERTMLAFIRKQADILVATTIIESGLDIPNANTIFINEADRYGLANLHQLRGRVGRYKHRAYAYLLLEEAKMVTPNAIRRLKAIEEFTELGAGFKIALRDLEIRGAGNILGAEQSGHIEAVGYELYCSLLESAVRALTHKQPKPSANCSIELAWRAYLPKNYVPGPKLKVELYRRLGRLRTLKELSEFRQELTDRFGALPPPAENLMLQSELRILAERWRIDRIYVEDEYLVLAYRSPREIERLAKAHPKGYVRIVDAKTAYVPLEEKKLPGLTVATAAKQLLSVKI